jgi:hypothetical protein
MSWDARRDEIKSTIESTWATFSRGERAGGSLVPHASFIRLQVTAKDHLDHRDRDLAGALRILRDVSTSSGTAKEQKEKWTRHFKEAAHRAAKRFTDSLDSDEKKWKPFPAFVGDLAHQEAHFLRLLAGLPLAETQGRILEWERQFVEERKKLQDKWRALDQRDRSADQQMEAIMKSLRESYERVLKEVANTHGRAQRAMRDFIKGMGVVDTALNPGTPSWWRDVYDEYLDRVDLHVTTVEEYRKRYREAFKREETTLILFGETRAAVRSFLKKTNLEGAKEALEKAHKASVDMAGKALTPAQKADAQRFVNDVYRDVKRTLDRFETAYNALIDEFAGIFIGPVGDRTVEDLLEVRRWNSHQSELTRINIQTELKRYHDEAREWFGVSLGGLDPAVRKHIEKQMKKDLERLSLAVKKAGDQTHLSAAVFLATFLRPKLLERVKQSKGGLQ